MTVPMDVSSAIDEAVSAALPVPQLAHEEAPPEAESRVAEAPVDTEAEADVADAAAASADTEAAEGDDAGTPTPDMPEGYVAVPTVSEGLATEFILKDEHGEVEVPALIVEYKANGKVRQDRLDQVVKLAQWGVYNQEREQKLQEEVEQQVGQYQQVLAEREAQIERLLTDDDFFESVRDAFMSENSPERRAERAEQRVADLKIQQQMQTISASGEQFYAQEVMPALQMIQQALPTLSGEELEARLELAMKAHAEVAPNGVPYVPPSRYDAIRQYIVEDLALWAQAAHLRRNQPAEQKSAELERAQIEAQKAKRAVGQKLKPVGQPGATPDRPAKARPIVSIDDAVESALSSVLSSIR